MDTLFQRYRNLTILAAVLFAQVLVLAFQVRRPTEAGPIRLARYWAVAAITPLEKGVVHTQEGIAGIWQNYVWLRGVRTENEQLRNENERLRLEQIRMAQDAAQARRLQALLGFKEQTVSQTVAAQVIGASGSETSRILYIDKGFDDGIRADMAVITSEGVVGKILRVFNDPTTRHTAQVLLLSDPTSGVGAILSNSRLQGILRGTPAGELLLHYVMSDEKVQPGEQVLTSGGDRVFPKGMPLGTVTQVSPGPDLFLNIRVKPAAQISRLEEVLVITKIAETTPTVDTTQSGPIRAADVLAQRLPTIVVQPPDAEGAKKQADPPSFVEWLRQQKAAQAAAKQGSAAPPTQQFVAPKNGGPASSPATSSPKSANPSTPKAGGTANPSVPKAGGPPPSAGSAAPKSATSTPKQPSATGQGGNGGPASSPATASPKSGAAASKQPAATGTGNNKTPADSSTAAPKKPATKKQPSETPASPPSQPPATPPGVTL